MKIEFLSTSLRNYIDEDTRLKNFKHFNAGSRTGSIFLTPNNHHKITFVPITTLFYICERGGEREGKKKNGVKRKKQRGR